MIFVVGSSRSGTTLLARVLGRHPDVFTLKELHFFEQLWVPRRVSEALSDAQALRLASVLYRNQRAGLLSPTPAGAYVRPALALLKERRMTAPELFQAFVYAETRAHGRLYPCDHTPRNVFYMGDILRLYPEARVVVMLRDPRDVLASQKHKWKTALSHRRDVPPREGLRYRINFHPITTSLLWRAAIKAGRRSSSHHRVFMIRFEDLVQHPARHVRELCTFLGIAYHRHLLDVTRTNSSFTSDAPVGFDTATVGRWKAGNALTATELFLCQRLCEPYMTELGYTIAPARPSPIGLATAIGAFPAKTALAVAANLGRYRSLPRAVARRVLA